MTQTVILHLYYIVDITLCLLGYYLPQEGFQQDLLFPTGGRGGTLAFGMDGFQCWIQNHRTADERVEQVQGRAGHDQVHLHGLLVQLVSQTD